MLTIIILQLLAGGIHEWSEAGIINMGQTTTHIIDTLAESSTIFTGILLGFIVLLFVMMALDISQGSPTS